MSESINPEKLVNDAFSTDWEVSQLAIADIIDTCEEDEKYIPQMASLAEKHLSGEVKEKILACELLGRINAKVSLSKIQDCLKDSNEDVREIAAKALGWLGDPSSVDSLISILSDPDDEVREVSCRALGEIGDKKAVDPLIYATRDEDIEVRLEAGIALGKLCDGKAIEPLIELLGDIDLGVIKGASESLVLFGEKALPNLEKIVEHPKLETLKDRRLGKQKKYASRLIMAIKAGKKYIDV
ncbi:MAG: HEAT repeat domain-containing protein [Promethearchaeota archaeon]